MKNEARPESESPHEESIEIHKETEICLDYIRWANCDWRWKKNKSQEEENYSEKACKFFFSPPKISACTPPAKKINNFISINKLKCASTGSVRIIWKTKQEF